MMIKLTRHRSAQAISRTFRGKNRVKWALKLLEGHRSNAHEFDSDVWKNAKKQLKIESHGKCAYCEASTSTVAHGDVEHYRPKSIYWWLAYCYDNYLYSCQICNQSFKSDNFPVAGVLMALAPPFPNPFPNNLTALQLSEMAARFAPDPLKDDEGFPFADFTAAGDTEIPHLINPYFSDPEPFFSWKADAVIKQVTIQPRNNSAVIKRTFEATEQFLGLNRQELCELRWKKYRTLNVLRGALDSEALENDDDLHAEIITEIKAMMADDAEYAAMVRYFVSDEWQLDLT